MNQQPPAAKKLTMADNAAVTGAFMMDAWIGGIVTVPSGWVAANIGFKVCDTEDGTYTILHDEDTDQPVQIANIDTSKAVSYKIPNEVFPAIWVKLWSKSATAATEDDVNQTGGPLNFTVMLK